ncbi:tol-pal system protein YbgF [Bermanella marisrubri]|uniref:Cell division coordinator CpoB n=1 Tax=Bermanella marisrubri TaxID=207949 RepID=Q1N0T0_9GAMM|nr:tol-pal system protein YbgF [Bermanella marisrubri]EAT11753.1 hypothetical protein RED65_05184 [Oceanobacter sp. RED65] [Bermanella marisrubri]QIZ83789.1 tol-pal system protein YbgF [Bermanella marisrubri]
MTIPLALSCALGLSQVSAETWSSLNNAQSSNAAQTPANVSPQTKPSTSSTASASNNSANQILFSEIEMLKQEIQRLQGVVEKQGYELRKLKAEQKERYLDLDRRLSQVAKSGSLASSSSSSGSEGREQYDHAFALMKERKFDEAISEFKSFLEAHPKSSLAVNGYYWLGQVYYNKGMLDEARKAFAFVVNQFPDHQKTLDSKYKLAVVLHRLGDKAQSKPILEAIVSDHKGTSTARFAQQYLKQHF